MLLMRVLVVSLGTHEHDRIINTLIKMQIKFKTGCSFLCDLAEIISRVFWRTAAGTERENGRRPAPNKRTEAKTDRALLKRRSALEVRHRIGKTICFGRPLDIPNKKASSLASAVIRTSHNYEVALIMIY